MHELLSITILSHEWGDFPITFKSEEVMSENHWQIASRVTQKSLFMATNVIFYFLHAILCPEHTISLKQLLIAGFAIVAKDGLFWLGIVTSPQLICDVTRTWGAGIVTSYSSIVLARANWGKGDLHKWITAVNIDFLPPSIHSLVCKKNKSIRLIFFCTFLKLDIGRYALILYVQGQILK